MPGPDYLSYGLIVSDSEVWVPEPDEIWHYADGAWERIDYGDPVAGGLPDGVFWGVGPRESLHRHDDTGWRSWLLAEHDLTRAWDNENAYAVAPDGSFWAGGQVWGCTGVTRFDGVVWTRFLPAACVSTMDIAPDGSVWFSAREFLDSELPPNLYVITPEIAVRTE